MKKIQFEQDFFAKNAQGISETFDEVLLLTRFLYTKPQIKNMNKKY